MHYYQFNIGDYAKHTRHLTLMEDLAYRRLLDLYYTSEKPLSVDVIKLARLVGMPDYQTEVSQVLDDFFLLTDDGYMQKRVDDEIVKYNAKADSARVNGKKGGRPQKPKITQPVNLANPEETGSKANQEPLTINQEPLTKKQVKSLSRFAPPSIKEVSDYCSERKNDVDPEKFIDFYESKGWLIGKNKMKSWKAAVRTWEKRDGEGTTGSKRTPQAKKSRLDIETGPGVNWSDGF